MYLLELLQHTTQLNALHLPRTRIRRIRLGVGLHEHLDAVLLHPLRPAYLPDRRMCAIKRCELSCYRAARREATARMRRPFSCNGRGQASNMLFSALRELLR